MLSIISVGITFVLFMIIAFILFVGGYKEEAIMIRNGTFGSVIFYALLVFCCASIPEGM